MINFLNRIIIKILNLICFKNTLSENNNQITFNDEKKNSNINYFENGVFIGRKFRIGGMSFQSLYQLNENFFFSKLVRNEDKKNLGNLRNEYRLLSLLSDDQYFCKVYSYIKNIDYSFIIMERYYIDLFQYINRVSRDIEIPLIISWIKMLLNGFNILHKKYNICHRDIKPENIMLTYNGQIIIIDFGLSKNFKYVSGAGTPNYVCPYMRNKSIFGNYGVCDGFKSDTWSLGVLIFNIITRKEAYINKNNEMNPIERYGYLNFLLFFLKENDISVENERKQILEFLHFFFEDYNKRLKLIYILIKFNIIFNNIDISKSEELFIESMKNINRPLLIV